MSLAPADGRLPRRALHQQALAGLLGRDLVVGCDHELVELTPLGLRCWPSSDYPASASRPLPIMAACLPISGAGAVGWLIVAGMLLVGASALLLDLCLHHTAATSAHIGAILRRADEGPTRELAT